MRENSKQSQAWASEFGKEYTDRNNMSIEEMDTMYEKQYGISRSDMNHQFLGYMDRNIRILEVGSNIGLQLQFLQKAGFKNLYGIEISPYAVELSKSLTKNVNIIQGYAQDMPFKDNYFDVVFTSGVLIHINPDEVSDIMREMYRCTMFFIWGFEYFSYELQAIKYREAKETTDLLWKADFPKLFRRSFPDLVLIKETRFKYLQDENEDVMYLLGKGGK
ncbi:hypothetical protein LCGC14_1444360 [marine sediment metagenome]|uniref:Methyltransferase type 11 domain-containing protein n=1 Tax=marine sediment metagenome TaxID=412755 RepID=A0A0F9MLM0_9ZZZZ